MLRRLSLAACLVTAGHAAAAQTLRDQLRSELFTFGTCGQPLCLAGDLSLHGGHFIPSAETGTASLLDFIGDALSGSVANAPISSASSGVTFQFVGGVPVKTATSSGPIFGERSQTL